MKKERGLYKGIGGEFRHPDLRIPLPVFPDEEKNRKRKNNGISRIVNDLITSRLESAKAL